MSNNNIINEQELQNCRLINNKYDRVEIQIFNLYEMLLNEVNRGNWKVNLSNGMIIPKSLSNDNMNNKSQLRFVAISKSDGKGGGRYYKLDRFQDKVEMKLAQDQFQSLQSRDPYLAALYRTRVSDYKKYLDNFRSKILSINDNFSRWRIVGIRKLLTQFLREYEPKQYQYEILFQVPDKSGNFSTSLNNDNQISFRFEPTDWIIFCNNPQIRPASSFSNENNRNVKTLNQNSIDNLRTKLNDNQGNQEFQCQDPSLTATLISVRQLIIAINSKMIKETNMGTDTWQQVVYGPDQFGWVVNKNDNRNGIQILKIADPDNLYNDNIIPTITTNSKLRAENLRLVEIKQIVPAADLWELKFVYLKSGYLFDTSFVLTGDDNLYVVACLE